MAFIWICLYYLTHLAAENFVPPMGNSRLFSAMALLLYTGSLFLWLFRSGRAETIRLCRIRTSKKSAVLAAAMLLLFPLYNCLTAAYLETNFSAILLTFCVCAAEEVFFRGFLLQYLKRYGIKASIIISSVIFAVYHLGNYSAVPDMMFVSFQTLSAFSAGMCYAVSIALLDSIVPCILAHFLTNLTADPSAVPEIQLQLLGLCIGLSCFFCICFFKNIKKYRYDKGE